MPSKKYDEDDIEYYIYEDTYSVDMDEDDNPYINPDLHNIGMENEKTKWVDAAHEDIVNMYNSLIQYKNDATSHFFEKLTFNRFLIFVAQNSHQHS